MGLFDKSNDPASNISSLVHTPEHRSLARQLDAESIILLENHNETLPISKAANIAMIGPMADFMNVGCHAFFSFLVALTRQQYGDFVVNGSHFRGVTPYAGVKAASKGGLFITLMV
jgi:beta-glucosidase